MSIEKGNVEGGGEVTLTLEHDEGEALTSREERLRLRTILPGLGR